MRIPIYKAGAAPTGEAPGRSFGARMSAQPFVQAELQKGAVTGEVFRQTGEFAQMRYKAAREAQIQQKILAGEDALRQTASDLENVDTNKLGRVFNDGGKPEEALWTQSIDKARQELLADVKDKESQRVLTDRFNQMELTQRYSLRGRIDQKIEAANNAARAARARQAATAIANGSDIATARLTLQNLGVDSVRLAQAGVGNPNALKRQEYAVVFDGAVGAVQNYVFNQDSRYQAAEDLRTALRENNPLLAREGQYAFAVLNLLPVQDQVKILNSVGSTAKYIDAPTLEEQKQATMLNASADDVLDRADVAVKALEKGLDIPINDIEMLNSAAAELSTVVDGTRAAKLNAKVSDLNAFNQLKTDLNSLGSPTEVAKVVNAAESGAYSGDAGSIDTEADLKIAEFARKYQSNMTKMLQDDPMAFVEQAGAVRVPDVDLSPQAFANGQTGINSRKAAVKQASAFYGVNVPLFTNAQAQGIVQMIRDDVTGGAPMLGMIAQEAGMYSQSVIDQLEAQGLQPELVQAMYTTDPALQRRLADVAQTPLADLKARTKTMAGDQVVKEIPKILAQDTRDLFSAYIRGGGQNAQEQWFTQAEVAEKLAYNYALGGLSPDAAAKRAAKEIFPAKDSVFSTSKGTYFVPDRADAPQVSTAASLILQDETVFDFVPILNLDTEYPSFVDAELNKAAIVSQGEWVVNDRSDGLVLHYRLSGDVLLPVFKEDGSEFDLSFDEILDLGRKISKKSMKRAMEAGGFELEQGYSQYGKQLAREYMTEEISE